MTLLLHGDAAFAGQGVVAECFAMSGTKGFRTGGTIHFVVNNQIGFTTAPAFARSSPYPSDVALMVQAPIFHVNGDDPEAVVHCARIATEFRQLFHKDVVVDMFCYRRFGHNEGDEPSFTQPLMYRAIRSHPCTLEIYSKRLIQEGILTRGRAAGNDRVIPANGSRKNSKPPNRIFPNKADWLDGRWTGLETAPRGDRRAYDGRRYRGPETRRPGDRTNSRWISRAPDHHRLMQAKQAMIETGDGIDWATGEALAFGTLLDEDFHVRLSGQDSSRGTFSQRHAALVDQETEERYIPLNHIRDGQAEFEVVDSLLSEAAVVGFEYGYSLAEPRALVLVGGAVWRFCEWRAGHDRPVHRVGRNEMAADVRALCCCCRTALKGRARNILPRGWNGFCSFAPTTICRSPAAPRRRIISMCCAGRCSAISASRWC